MPISTWGPWRQLTGLSGHEGPYGTRKRVISGSKTGHFRVQNGVKNVSGFESKDMRKTRQNHVKTGLKTGPKLVLLWPHTGYPYHPLPSTRYPPTRVPHHAQYHHRPCRQHGYRSPSALPSVFTRLLFESKCAPQNDKTRPTSHPLQGRHASPWETRPWETRPVRQWQTRPVRAVTDKASGAVTDKASVDKASVDKANVLELSVLELSVLDLRVLDLRVLNLRVLKSWVLSLKVLSLKVLSLES